MKNGFMEAEVLHRDDVLQRSDPRETSEKAFETRS
jgi:hypothetical protein